jgi:2-dehydro-3-deoxyphosphogluconate aldolase/(4S)-4-hydroxy-2-oxoglutarate aldolase
VLPTEENLRGWFEAGVTCVGMGSKLISKEVVQNPDFEQLEQLVRDTLQIIKSIKKNTL